MTNNIFLEDNDKHFDHNDQERNINTDNVTRKQKEQVRQIIQECKWTDKLQRLVDYGNANILKSFHLWLEMEEVTK
jgi:hypothetical protein